MEPFSLRVLKALCNCFEQITPQNGYSYDLSPYTDAAGRPARRVFRGRAGFGDNDPLPMISILEHPDALAQMLKLEQEHTPAKGDWVLLVQGFVREDPENPTDPAHAFAADAVRALAEASRDKYNLLGLGGQRPCVSDIAWTRPVVRPPDDEISSFAFFYLRLTLTLVEDLKNPFA